MKVLHICSDYFGSHIYKELIDNLKGSNIENVVYVPKSQFNSLNDNSLIIAKRKYNLFDRLLFFRKETIGFKEVRNRISLGDIDVIHSHNLFSGGYLAYKLGKKFNIPYIVAIRNTDVNIFFRFLWYLRFTGIKIMNNARYIIFISPTYKDYTLRKYVPIRYQNIFETKSIVFENGIDKYFLENIFYRESFEWDRLSVRLIFVGTLNRNKNVSTIIKVAKLLSKNYDVTLTLVGRVDDPKFLNIEKKYSFIRYVPFSSKEGVLDLLRQADIFIMPSLNETFGLVYVEALSQGLPVIYSKGQGFDGYFKSGEVGFSVDPKDHKEIAKLVLRVYENYSKISSNCSMGAMAFNWQSISEKYMQLYQNAVK